MATFSGRVMVPKVQSGAEVRVRPSRVLSASAEAMASGSGSSCMRMSTRSASAKCSRIRSTRARADGPLERGPNERARRGAESGTEVAPGTARPSSVTASSGTVGKGLARGGHRAGETGRGRGHHIGPRWSLARLPVGVGIRGIAGHDEAPARAETAAKRGPGHEVHRGDRPGRWCRRRGASRRSSGQSRTYRIMVIVCPASRAAKRILPPRLRSVGRRGRAHARAETAREDARPRARPAPATIDSARLTRVRASRERRLGLAAMRSATASATRSRRMRVAPLERPASDRTSASIASRWARRASSSLIWRPTEAAAGTALARVPVMGDLPLVSGRVGRRSGLTPIDGGRQAPPTHRAYATAVRARLRPWYPTRTSSATSPSSFSPPWSAAPRRGRCVSRSSWATSSVGSSSAPSPRAPRSPTCAPSTSSRRSASSSSCSPSASSSRCAISCASSGWRFLGGPLGVLLVVGMGTGDRHRHGLGRAHRHGGGHGDLRL